MKGSIIGSFVSSGQKNQDAGSFTSETIFGSGVFDQSLFQRALTPPPATQKQEENQNGEGRNNPIKKYSKAWAKQQCSNMKDTEGQTVIQLADLDYFQQQILTLKSEFQEVQQNNNFKTNQYRSKLYELIPNNQNQIEEIISELQMTDNNQEKCIDLFEVLLGNTKIISQKNKKLYSEVEILKSQNLHLMKAKEVLNQTLQTNDLMHLKIEKLQKELEKKDLLGEQDYNELMSLQKENKELTLELNKDPNLKLEELLKNKASIDQSLITSYIDITQLKPFKDLQRKHDEQLEDMEELKRANKVLNAECEKIEIKNSGQELIIEKHVQSMEEMASVIEELEEYIKQMNNDKYIYEETFNELFKQHEELKKKQSNQIYILSKDNEQLQQHLTQRARVSERISVDSKQDDLKDVSVCFTPPALTPHQSHDQIEISNMQSERSSFVGRDSLSSKLNFKQVTKQYSTQQQERNTIAGRNTIAQQAVLDLRSSLISSSNYQRHQHSKSFLQQTDQASILPVIVEDSTIQHDPIYLYQEEHNLFVLPTFMPLEQQNITMDSLQILHKQSQQAEQDQDIQQSHQQEIEIQKQEQLMKENKNIRQLNQQLIQQIEQMRKQDLDLLNNNKELSIQLNELNHIQTNRSTKFDVCTQTMNKDNNMNINDFTFSISDSKSCSFQQSITNDSQDEIKNLILENQGIKLKYRLLVDQIENLKTQYHIKLKEQEQTINNQQSTIIKQKQQIIPMAQTLNDYLAQIKQLQTNLENQEMICKFCQINNDDENQSLLQNNDQENQYNRQKPQRQTFFSNSNHLKDIRQQQELDESQDCKLFTNNTALQTSNALKQPKNNEQLQIQSQISKFQNENKANEQNEAIQESNQIQISSIIEECPHKEDENKGGYSCQSGSNSGHHTNQQVEVVSVDSIKQQQEIEDLRRKCKNQLAVTKDKRSKMFLDQSLRNSYYHNIHHFNNTTIIQSQQQSNSNCKHSSGKNSDKSKLCTKCKSNSGSFNQNQTASKNNDLIQKEQIVYDQSEIQYINDNQGQIFISSVDINPYLKYGIRTHYEKLTVAHCIHSIFNIFHRDFILIWLHLLPTFCVIWQLILLHLGHSHIYTFDQNSSNWLICCSALGIIIMWLITKSIYFIFYAMSYKVEERLNKWVSIANIGVILAYCLLFTHSLINYNEPLQVEFGYITAYALLALLILNIIVIFNPLQREEGNGTAAVVEETTQNYCSGQNIILTISIIFCLTIIQIHHFFASTQQQSDVFYKPFHSVLGLWVVAHFISYLKMPERYLPTSRYIHNYFSSDIIKGIMLVIAIIATSMVLRNTMMISHKGITKEQLSPQLPPIDSPQRQTSGPPPIGTSNNQKNSALVNQFLTKAKDSKLDQKISQSKKELQETEAQLEALKKQFLERNQLSSDYSNSINENIQIATEQPIDMLKILSGSKM